MNAKTTKKWLIGLLSLTLGLTLFGCKDQSTTSDVIIDPEAIIPAITYPDLVYFQGDGFSVTYQDLYEEIKINDGLNQLLMMIDEDLLATQIASVTSSEIAEKIKELTYGTTEDTVIADMTLEQKAEAERLYLENLRILGYQENPESYLRLVIARENFAINQMSLAENEEESWYIGPQAIAKYYDENMEPDLRTIKIRFTSEPDARNIMESLNLVGRSDGFLYRYTGTKPINEVTRFDETNTVKLTNDEVIVAFIQMYNLVYGDYRSLLEETATISELEANPDLVVEYATINAFNPNLTKFLYQSLGTLSESEANPESSLFYTYVPAKYYGSKDTSYYMICNLSKTVKADTADFDGDEAALKTLIGADLYEKIEQTMIDNNLKSTGFVSARLVEFRNTHDFQLLDYYLAIDYQSVDSEYEMEGDGHATTVATYDEKSITADQLLTYAMNQNAPLYLLYASQLKALQAAYYDDVYCPNPTACQVDYTLNTSKRMLGHQDELASIKTQFEASYYSYYYSFEEYIYLAFGATSEADMIERYFIRSTLQPLMIFDLLIDNDWELFEDYFLDYLNHYVENYFSLYVNHLLIYIDRDENGSPDDYDKFKEGLTDETAYDTLLANFQTAILAYMAEDDSHTFSSLISTYNRAKRSDAIWGEFKNFGLALMTENLSSQDPITYLSAKDTFDPKFTEGLVQGYQSFQLDEHKDKIQYLYETFIDTSFGSHLVLLLKGPGFTRPTGEYAMEYDNGDQPKYLIDFVNPNDLLSLSQLKAYARARVMELAFGNDEETLEEMQVELAAIPVSVQKAIDAYFINAFDSVFVIGSINHVLAENYLVGSILNSHPAYSSMSSQAVMTAIGDLGDIYYQQVFVPLETE